jgi:hypothetical protein
MTAPHIPDDAFLDALNRIGTMMDLIPPTSPRDDVYEIAENFYRALGLDGEEDERAVRLVEAVLAHLRMIAPSEVPPEDVTSTVLGMMLGLLLAQGTGWEAPISAQ